MLLRKAKTRGDQCGEPIIDAVAGQPFRTFHVLGGILTFFMLSRTHPLLEEFKEAEQEE